LSRTWQAPSKYPLDKNYSTIAWPALKFVFLDEREDSINDACFESNPDTLYQLVDFPGSYHGNGCTLVFADGHAEVHRWRDPRTMPVLKPGQLLPLNVNLPGNQDVLWLSQHCAGVLSYP
jgi:prepilin-type processing-associated H-X9-DG protein